MAFLTGPPLSQDRLVRKEVALGVIREYQPPQAHIGLQMFAPFKEVQSDDVIFGYLRGLSAGLAPARAEDAESEMAGNDDSFATGRASLIDWALKDHYDPSDVSRYRQGLIMGGLVGAESLSLFVNSMTEDFAGKIARDMLIRRRKLDNRLEWLIMQALDTGSIVYNDGKILFNVAFNRPSGQQDIAPPTGNLWSSALANPIEDILTIQQNAFDTYGIELDRMLMSRKIFRYLRSSKGFTDALTGSNPLYKVTGWGVQAAADFIQEQTGTQIIIYDSVYRTRPTGSNTFTNTRFTRQNSVIFLPSETSLGEYDDAIGFGATLTSPHPEGNWTPGFYEWEKDTGPDPWGHDMGNGIKAFPVFPHLDMTWVMTPI